MSKQFLIATSLLAGIMTLSNPVQALSPNTNQGTPKANNPLMIAQQRRIAFVVTYQYYGRDVKIKSVATGKIYNIKYASPIGLEVGDTISVIINDDRWITVINERTGQSAAITYVNQL